MMVKCSKCGKKMLRHIDGDLYTCYCGNRIRKRETAYSVHVTSDELLATGLYYGEDENADR